MPKLTWDHVHLRSPNPEATAKWFESMLGGEIIRTMQQGEPRIDVKLGGANIFIAPVKSGDGVNSPPTTPYQGLDHFAHLHRHRRHRGRTESQRREVHQGADDSTTGHAHLLHPRTGRHLDRAARSHRCVSSSISPAIPASRRVRTTRQSAAFHRASNRRKRIVRQDSWRRSLLAARQETPAPCPVLRRCRDLSA